MRTELITETDYYELVLEILHPPRKSSQQLTANDRDASSRIQLRGKTKDGVEPIPIQTRVVKDSLLYNRQTPFLEDFGHLFFVKKDRCESTARSQQQEELHKHVAELSREMHRLEENMQTKLAYYHQMLPDLTKTAEQVWPEADREFLNKRKKLDTESTETKAIIKS